MYAASCVSGRPRVRVSGPLAFGIELGRLVSLEISLLAHGTPSENELAAEHRIIPDYVWIPSPWRMQLWIPETSKTQ